MVETSVSILRWRVEIPHAGPPGVRAVCGGDRRSTKIKSRRTTYSDQLP